MIKILYEDDAVLVAVKPAGLESQASRKLEPDMVSEIKNYLLRSRRRKGEVYPQQCPQIHPHRPRSPMWELSTDWINRCQA